MARKVWLTDKADTKISSLSRGMHQRIGLARTLLPRPAVILLDEPAAGLDPAGRVQFRKLLVTLRDMGCALVVSSHILSDMGEYCSHIGIMERGRLLRMGTVAELVDEHHAERTHAVYHIDVAGNVAAALAVIRELPDISDAAPHHGGLTLRAPVGPPAPRHCCARSSNEACPSAASPPEAADLEAAYLRAGLSQVE